MTRAEIAALLAAGNMEIARCSRVGVAHSVILEEIVRLRIENSIARNDVEVELAYRHFIQRLSLMANTIVAERN